MVECLVGGRLNHSLVLMYRMGKFFLFDVYGQRQVSHFKPLVIGKGFMEALVLSRNFVQDALKSSIVAVALIFRSIVF